MSLRSPLGRVLGRGAARSGVHHWWLQRLSAVALVPLGLWLLASLAALPAADFGAVHAWMAHGGTALPLLLLVLTGAWHSQLGVRVVIEDYVHGTLAKPALLVLVTLAHALLAAAGSFAVLKVALGAAP